VGGREVWDEEHTRARLPEDLVDSGSSAAATDRKDNGGTVVRENMDGVGGWSRRVAVELAKGLCPANRLPVATITRKTWAPSWAAVVRLVRLAAMRLASITMGRTRPAISSCSVLYCLERSGMSIFWMSSPVTENPGRTFIEGTSRTGRAIKSSRRGVAVRRTPCEWRSSGDAKSCLL
jgi:hypothetical protein